MRQLIVTILFFVFMFLLVNMYIGRANAQDYDYYDQQQQIQQLREQQDQFQLQQDQRQLNNSITAINHGCVYAGEREFCN